jgi:predicted RNase H-like HicB family nuclease
MFLSGGAPQRCAPTAGPMTERRNLIVIEGSEDADYSAYGPDLRGCVATGATLEECERKVRDAIAFHVEGSVRAVKPAPSPRAWRCT